MKRHWMLIVLLAGGLVGPGLAGAQVEQGEGAVGLLGSGPGQAMQPTTVADAPAKPLPLTLGIDYTLVSDYVWRGVNFNEDVNGVNHQLNLAAAYDAGPLGTFGAGVWLQWFSGYRDLNPDADSDLEEVDLTLSWSYDLSRLAPRVPLTVELGWIMYTFPELSGDERRTHELYVTLALDDSVLFGTDEPVLNPFVSYYHDVDEVKGGWLEFGISHDFALSATPLGDVPVLRDLTLTPSLVVGIDHRYWENTTRWATVGYGLELSYDLFGALGVAERYGSMTVTGFVNFSQRIDGSAADVISDEFYGGLNVAYQW